MSPSTAKKTCSVPFNLATTAHYLRRLQLPAQEADAQRVLMHFNLLAEEGYDLSRAHTTQEMEALSALGLFKEAYSVRRFSSSTEDNCRADGSTYVSSLSTIKGMAGDKEYLEVDESDQGFLDAIYKANAKVMRKFFDVTNAIEVTGYHVDSFRTNQNTAAPTRVTITFSNAMATQFVHTNQVYASFRALKAGFDMDLRLRGTQPR